jgi:hypothetical protein
MKKINRTKLLKYKRRRQAKKIAHMIIEDKIGKINKIRLFGKRAKINLSVMLPAMPEFIDVSCKLAGSENEN